jgi:hypothetical protein
MTTWESGREIGSKVDKELKEKEEESRTKTSVSVIDVSKREKAEQNFQ